MNHYIFDIKTKKTISINEVKGLFQQLVDLLNLNVLAKKEHIFSN